MRHERQREKQILELMNEPVPGKLQRRGYPSVVLVYPKQMYLLK